MRRARSARRTAGSDTGPEPLPEVAEHGATAASAASSTREATADRTGAVSSRPGTASGPADGTPGTAGTASRAAAETPGAAAEASGAAPRASGGGPASEAPPTARTGAGHRAEGEQRPPTPAPGPTAPGTADAPAPGTADAPAPGAPASHGAHPGRTASGPTASDGPATPPPSVPDAAEDVTPAGRAGEGAPERRPGDIAREALRSARQEALHARAEAGRRGDRPAPRRTGAAPAPAPRLPRTSRGDRVADARARAVREALADAFRMPSDPDEAPVPDQLSAPDEAPAPDQPSAPDEAPAPDQPSAPDGPSVPYEPSAAYEPPAPEPRPGDTDAGAARVPPPDEGAHDTREPTGRQPSTGAAAPIGASAPGPEPRTPRSMAAPDRDGDHRRTFPAFPPREGGADGIADTWWGNAWVTALEEGALDAARLARGRAYAQRGHVDAITVTPGLVLAYVRGSRPRPYRVQVRLRTFSDTEWDRFLDAAADRPGHIAALLDKVMPQSLADCGVPLLPGPGDLAPRCSCPDSGHPCKHAAALCYATARLLDADPFVLLLLRGRGEREVLDDLSRRSAARAARDTRPEPLPGIRATEVLAQRVRPPLPAPLPPPPHPEQPPVYPGVPGGPDAFALDQLATDAAARAHALLTTGRDPVGGLTLWQDAVRLAAARPGSGLTAATRSLYASLATAAGRTPADLARAVAAWRQGGPAGLDALEEPWDPPAGRFDRARPLLLAADLPAFRPWRNRLTHPRGHVQLRLGRDHLWYAYESEPGRDDWWPRGTPDPDPVGALTGMDTPGPL
ncbi:SWIM zinc finger family protein [Streptomyces sp. NPDC029526]|uniref:SWIM zinc finger family protein n=1 Tax=Streptomyces sp. NPDC029526 TaxID=3155728 RepID=UPI0033E7956B